MDTTKILVISVVVLVVAIVIFTGLYFYRSYSNPSSSINDQVDNRSGGSNSSGIGGGNVDEFGNPIPLGYKFVKPTPVSVTPMSTINDTVNEYQEPNVTVQNHNVTLIKDLSDDEEDEIESVDDEGNETFDNEGNDFELPFDAADVLVIEEANDAPMSFARVVFNVISDPNPVVVPSTAKVEVIEERTIDNKYITDGNSSIIGGDAVVTENINETIKNKDIVATIDNLKEQVNTQSNEQVNVVIKLPPPVVSDEMSMPEVEAPPAPLEEIPKSKIYDKNDNPISILEYESEYSDANGPELSSNVTGGENEYSDDNEAQNKIPELVLGAEEEEEEEGVDPDTLLIDPPIE